MFRTVCALLFGIFMTFVFLLSGITINILQALLYLALYNRNRSLYRKLNYYLIYSSWTQILAVAEWWSNSSMTIYGDEESLRMFGREHCMVLMNHKYDVDWVFCWFICEKLGMLGNAKTCAKKALRNVPIIGWGWVFAEMIFLERNWEKDKLILETKLKNLVEYDDPIMLLYFCEGTRFTPEKHAASIEFAKARNLPQLKHHLCPRTSGFNFAAAFLKDKIPAVYDVQLGFPEGPIKPTFSNMLRGHSFTADLYIKRIPMSEVPTDSNEATSKWLHELYQGKDKLMDEYYKTNQFPLKHHIIRRSYRSFLNSLFWIIVVGLPFLYLLFKLLTMGSMLVTSITMSVIIVLFSAMYYMIRATKASKGSSYGKDKSPAKSSNGSVNHSAGPLDKDSGPSTNQEDGIKAQEACPQTNEMSSETL